MKNCKRLALLFMATSLWVAGETPETIEETLKFAQELDWRRYKFPWLMLILVRTLHNFVEAGYLRSDIEMTDETGHQLPR